MKRITIWILCKAGDVVKRTSIVICNALRSARAALEAKPSRDPSEEMWMWLIEEQQKMAEGPLAGRQSDENLRRERHGTGQ